VKFTFITNQYGITIITIVAFQQPILWFCWLSNFKWGEVSVSDLIRLMVHHPHKYCPICPTLLDMHCNLQLQGQSRSFE